MKSEAMYMTAGQYKKSKYDKAILAVGSCECHGDHLPLANDTMVSYRLAVKVAEKVDGLLVLPPVTVGYIEHYAHFPFTLSLSSETLVEVLKEIMTSVIKNGITKIFVMNGHDGNIAPIEIACREVKMANPEARIASLDEWWVAGGKLLPGLFEVWDGLGHAGEGETSIALSLYPELVDMKSARGVVPNNLPANINIKWNFAELTDCGATGDPTKATAEKGKKMEDALIKLISDFMSDMDKKDWNYNSDISAL